MFLAWFSLLSFTTHVYATAPTITGVTGASNVVTTGEFTIYGGLAGVACSGDGSATCNSCTSDGTAATTGYSTCSTSPLCQCNQSRIYDSLVVRISLNPGTSTSTSTSGSTTTNTSQIAYAIAAPYGSTTKTAVTPNTSTNDGTFIDFKWSTLCTLMGTGVNSCESLYSSTTTTSFVVEVDVWIDTDASGNSGPSGSEQSIPIYFHVVLPPSESVYGNTATDGIGGFTPFPGDGKVYLTNLQAADSFPNMSYSVAAIGVNVLASPNGEDDNNYSNGSVNSTSLTINSDGTLANQIVSGLNNDQLYFFRIAVVDQASNVVQYFPAEDGIDASCTSASPSASCPYAATPSQVLGLLTKDVNCFVATAAYGSSLEPKLDTFRSFRRRFLLPYKLGRKFVDNYYIYGTRAAGFIADKPAVRAAVRLGLWPIYGFSLLALRFGLSSALALVMFALGLLGLMLFTLPRRLFAK